MVSGGGGGLGGAGAPCISIWRGGWVGLRGWLGCLGEGGVERVGHFFWVVKEKNST